MLGGAKIYYHEYMVSQTQPLIIVGDIHGHYAEFLALLKSAGLTSDGAKWTGGDAVMVQIGDAVDKGPESMAVDETLDMLQEEAPLHGGGVVRLIGNHELEIILGNLLVSELPTRTKLAYQKSMRERVLNGKMKAAFHMRGLLFTHAGVNRRLYDLFQKEIPILTEAKAAALINKIFLDCVKHQFFKHPIFNISVSRGGTDKYGGIFWEDLGELYSSMPRSPLRQVVGHTMVEEISVNTQKNIIAVDVGMHRLIQYLRVQGNKLEIVTVKTNFFKK